ncbi:MAG: tRNA pseudouridine(38-40) synthase TruA [Holosporaceae bacterium]|jgi:tRNA pseudouridine38-40 synthase|nr:tRNA pseudouridine(38-40) synthase TruA [Holosporaceae bacterium]
MNRYKITVEYDGTPFFGWQRQKDLSTVQQHLEESLFPLTRVAVPLYGAGRTDTGVHAIAQVAHFDTERDLDCFRIQECMNAHLRSVPICVLSIEKVPPNFDARFSALERFYIYKILNRRAKSCIDAHRVWHLVPRMDEKKMHSAAQCLVGKHDFSSFRAAGCQSSSPIKTLNKISVERENDLIIVKTSARSFLYHQVRNMVGSLSLVGCGKWSEEDFYRLFKAGNRTKTGPTAPAFGLYFTGVEYGAYT